MIISQEQSETLNGADSGTLIPCAALVNVSGEFVQTWTCEYLFRLKNCRSLQLYP